MDDYLTIILLGLYGGAFLLHFLAGARVGAIVFAVGAGLNFFLVAQRWVASGRVPLSNMYEIMLALGFCVFILYLITEWGFKVRAPWVDPLIAVAVIIPVAFVFDKEIQPLMPALQSPLFFPHVFTYILSYAAMTKACALAGISLGVKDAVQKTEYERGTYRVVKLGFPLLTAGLLLGAVWAKLAWGDYWSWDPKEMWSLITWMTYLGYLHLRHRKGPKHAWVPWLAILGFVMVIITLFWVNLSRIFEGLHSYA